MIGTYTMVNCTTADKPWCRTHGQGGGYNRVIIHNSTTMEWYHVQNVDNKVTDSFVVHVDKHGPFPPRK